MRGKERYFSRLILTNGITPAYAGKSQPGTILDMQCEDHPRLCGEKGADRRQAQQQLGSPPPMRGKVSLEFWIFTVPGITPAYAGKSR